MKIYREIFKNTQKFTEKWYVEIVSFSQDFKQAVQDCKELWAPGSNSVSVQCFICDFSCLTIMISAISASGMERVHGSVQTGKDHSNMSQ